MSVNKIKVLHLVGGLGAGGTEKVMQLFATHADTSRFTVAVHSQQDGPRAPLLREAGVQTYVGGDMGVVLERFAPDIIHLHRAGWAEPERMRDVRLYKQLARMRGEKVVVLETNVFGRHDASPGAAALDATLYVSRFCAQRYAAQYGVQLTSPRHHVLYNPVDTDFFATHSIPVAERDYAVPSIGRVSRPDPGKWSSLALDFVPLLLESVPDLRYRIIGMTDAARGIAVAHGIQHVVEEVPPLLNDGELADFFNTVSLLAHANDTGESFGLIIAEAMACGLPVITHPAMALRDNAQLELVENGVTGFVARTPQEYAQAVVLLLRHPEAARSMGRAGQEKAQRLFRVQHVVSRLQEIYEDLLDRAGGL